MRRLRSPQRDNRRSAKQFYSYITLAADDPQISLFLPNRTIWRGVEAKVFLNIERITDLERLKSLIPEWQTLDEGLTPRVPFTSPIWCMNWWETFKRNTFYARDALNSYAFRDLDGHLICVAPMFISHRPGWAAVRSRELQFFGADANITEIRGPICKFEWTAQIVTLLVEQIKSESCCDWVQWRGLRMAEGAALWPSDIAVDAGMTVIDYVLPLPETWKVLKDGLPRNIKESLRKCYNSLARDAHEFEMRVVDRPEDIPQALDTFFRLHRSRSSKTDTIWHEDIFQREAGRVFLTKYCSDMSHRKDLKIFQLVIQERVVATRLGFALGDDLYLYYSGYDVEWARYSVMTTLVAEAIKWSISNGFKVVNLSTGTDVSKTRWRPESITYQGGKMPAVDLTSRAVFHIIEGLRRARAR